jgi:hypothetical protein
MSETNKMLPELDLAIAADVSVIHSQPFIMLLLPPNCCQGLYNALVA